MLTTMLVRSVILRLKLRVTTPAEQPQIRARAQRRACRAICSILGISVRVVAPPVDDRMHAGPSLIVSNHLGVSDGVVLASVFDAAFVGKIDIVGWPGIGWITRGVGLIPIDRDRKMAAAKLVSDVSERLDSGVSVIAFPEGTTSDGSTVRPFRTGAFQAIVASPDRTILPVSLSYASRSSPSDPRSAESVLAWGGPELSMREHSWRVLQYPRTLVELRIGTPFSVSGATRRNLAEAAHAAVEELRLRRAPVPTNSEFGYAPDDSNY